MKRKSEKVTPVYINSDNNASTGSINSAVVIPALNPIPNLVDFVRKLLKCGVPQVIVVNDGSDSSFSDIFRKVEQMEHCTVLIHKVNRGKGRALKTAFSYFNEHFSHLDGVVTADADGQHDVEDICKICRRLSVKKDCLILGVRNFKQSNVPKRSYIGNTVTSRIFQLLYGCYLNDTQTGLRGIPVNELQWMAEMEGERYDYEINMLIKARHHNLGFLTIPIKTLYFDNNSGSHYSTVKDSARIFVRLISGLIQYSASSVISGIVDILGFFVLNTIVLTELPPSVRILASTVIARIVSSICNFTVNRRLVFTDTGALASSAARYYILCILLMMASYGLVYTTSLFWTVNESVIKLIIDFALGFISYQIQLHWVFRNKDSTEVTFPSGVINRPR